MIIIIFIVVVIFSFIVVVVVVGTNAYAQFDKVKERLQHKSEVVPVSAGTEAINMTDEIKLLCIKIDASNAINQIIDKEQQAQCKKFLDMVSIYEMSEPIDKHIKK
jgi:flagellar biosynthesis/type III secretory pathway chaperone